MVDAAVMDYGRLKWLCRRGVRELDVVLEAWLSTMFSAAPPERRIAFAELLAMSDPQLFDVLLGRSEVTDAVQREVVKELRDLSQVC